MSATFTNLLYHVVFSTKNRIPLIGKDLQTDLYAYIGGIIRNRRGVLLEIGGVADHVHLAARFPADLTVADMVRDFKSNSTRWHNRRPESTSRFGWQTGYAAFSVSESQLGAVRQYIRRQEQHHKSVSFKQELISLLEKHKVKFDERYILD
jgi:REP element-mobilizing transposase RayT